MAGGCATGRRCPSWDPLADHHRRASPPHSSRPSTARTETRESPRVRLHSREQPPRSPQSCRRNGATTSGVSGRTPLPDARLRCVFHSGCAPSLPACQALSRPFLLSLDDPRCRLLLLLQPPTPRRGYRSPSNGLDIGHAGGEIGHLFLHVFPAPVSLNLSVSQRHSNSPTTS
jgi:hypothetical protein